MKIIKESKEGTEIFLEKNDAIVAFTKEGVRMSSPQILTKEEMESDDVEELMKDWVNKNNPSLGAFFAVMRFLEEANEFVEHKSEVDEN